MFGKFADQQLLYSHNFLQSYAALVCRPPQPCLGVSSCWQLRGGAAQRVVSEEGHNRLFVHLYQWMYQCRSSVCVMQHGSGGLLALAEQWLSPVRILQNNDGPACFLAAAMFRCSHTPCSQLQQWFRAPVTSQREASGWSWREAVHSYTLWPRYQPWCCFNGGALGENVIFTSGHLWQSCAVRRGWRVNEQATNMPITKAWPQTSFLCMQIPSVSRTLLPLADHARCYESAATSPTVSHPKVEVFGSLT